MSHKLIRLPLKEMSYKLIKLIIVLVKEISCQVNSLPLGLHVTTHVAKLEFYLIFPPILNGELESYL